jgi:dTDP-4-amino-4,6-dideoxygalactose transaminase
MGWEGHTVGIADPRQKQEAVRKAVGLLGESAALCRAAGLTVSIVSGGGSSDYRIAAGLGLLTEVQAGGAILCDDEDLRERCYAFHNNGSGLKAIGAAFSYKTTGFNLRMTEFQGALLLAQMTRLEEQTRTRDENARYLTAMLKEIPGVLPARIYQGCTRNAYHLYMLRYRKEQFAGLPRARFLKALAAEGIPASGGYSPLNKQPFIKEVLQSRGYQRLFSKERLKQWDEQNQCPANDQLCEQAVWFTQSMLLGPRRDMEQIAEAIRKIQASAAELNRGGA